MNIQKKLENYLDKPIAQAADKEIYGSLLTIVQEMASVKERTDSKKKVYYISAEFLIGKLLSNNMINLGIYQEVKEMLDKNGKDICRIEEMEADLLSATEVWADWQHVSSIPWQLWVLQETVSV